MTVMHPVPPLLAAVVLGSLLGLGGPTASAQAPQLPKGLQSSFDAAESTVQKVFSVEDDGHRFIAYVATWKGTEVIVSDPLARSDLRVGDTISFIAHRVSLPGSAKGVASLSFTILDTAAAGGKGGDLGLPAASPEEQGRLMKIALGDLSAARDETERFCALSPAAKKAMTAGDTEKARALATELERLLPKFRDHWSYGNAVQDANQVLGRIALAEGNVVEAKRRLLASADSKGSPQMNSFGPNLQLAKDLLAHGESATVIQYLERCRAFWSMGTERLDAWTEAVRKGSTPEFGANLHY